ncbi:uncharacterized protein [Choristoneura fumiferana]|uniref:uncharacterized protein n=1 Tax=Choristoneura fumiferana TaxID=7141 RepID=UPI003D159718
MGLTAAERQKRYKEKLKQNAEKYEEYKKKKRENYHKKKRLVKDLTPKERYNARVIWKLRKKNVKQRKQNLNRVLDITPPSSPSLIQEPLNEDVNLPGIDAAPLPPGPKDKPNKKAQGKKKIRRDRSKLHRDNLRLKEQVEKLKRECEKYRKRCQRNGIKKIKTRKVDAKTKYQQLSTAMKASYQRMKTLKEKRILKNIMEEVEGPEKPGIIEESLGITYKLRTLMKVKVSATKLKKIVEAFFLRDDVSRATAGKKETCTIDGQKIQKRFLLDNMKILFKTFKQENPGVKCLFLFYQEQTTLCCECASLQWT